LLCGLKDPFPTPAQASLFQTIILRGSRLIIISKILQIFHPVGVDCNFKVWFQAKANISSGNPLRTQRLKNPLRLCETFVDFAVKNS
jgi:hypothetical protein